MITRRQRPLPHPALVVRLYVHLKGLFFFSKLVIKTTHKHTHTQPSLPYHLSLHEHITTTERHQQAITSRWECDTFHKSLNWEIAFLYPARNSVLEKKPLPEHRHTHTHSHSHRYTHEYTNNGLRNEEKKACSRIHCILYITYTKMQDRQWTYGPDCN